MLGTVAYMAPEQLDGRGAGPPADVYALAAISYEALSGKRPREGSTPLEIAHRIATEGAPDLLDVWPTAPKEAARVLKRGMASESEDRQGSAGEFARELSHALEDSPEESMQKTRFLGRRSKAAAAAPAAAAPAAAAAATPAAAQAQAQPDPAPTPRHAPAAATPPSASPPRRTPPPFTTSAAGPRRRPRAGAIALVAIFVALAAATIAGAILSGGDDKNPSSSGGANNLAQPQADTGKTKKKEPKAEKQPKESAPAPHPHPPRRSRATPVPTMRLAAPS